MLKPCLDFVIPDFVFVLKDRTFRPGGCASFIRNGIEYRAVLVENYRECVVEEIWSHLVRITRINVYNPYNNPNIDDFGNIMKHPPSPVIWPGEFNAHCNLWGSDKRDLNGAVVESFLN